MGWPVRSPARASGDNDAYEKERLHGTVRQREKVMRAMKTEETPIIEGHRLFYNFIKPHMALDGKTPSEKAGIEIEGDNKWLTLMKTAIRYKNYKKLIN